MYALILAGGVGTRFWPYSRRARPKQLLPLVNGKSLILQTVERLEHYPGTEGLYTIASPALNDSLRAELPHLSPSQFLVEPSGRNTAPAIALSALIIRKRHGDVVMGVFPADHLIRKEKYFRKALDLAIAKASEGENLVTMGIQPTYPATGYGYVEFEREGKGDVHRVSRFTEKPDQETARVFIEGGQHLWNGGIFLWKVSTILDQFAQHLPATFRRLSALEELIDTPDFIPALEKTWPKVDATSVDYGILEKAKISFMVETRFEWHDLGSWHSLQDVLPADKKGNVVQGDVALVDSSNSLVFSEDRFTAVIGAENLIVVSTADATIVVPRDQSDRVGEVVRWLEERKKGDLL